MAPVIGHAPIAISAVIVGTTAVIIRICAVIDRAAIVARAALGRGDRKAGPDNTGKSCGCGGATAAPIEPAAGGKKGGLSGPAHPRHGVAPAGGAWRSRPRVYRPLSPPRHRPLPRGPGGGPKPT